jgi:hypothetical protein
MRLIVVSLFCCAGLLAQPQTSPKPRPTHYFALPPIAQSATHAALQPNLDTPQTTPEGQGGELVIVTKSGETILSGQPCSIPPIQVPAVSKDQMVIQPQAARRNVEHMPVINVPAPPCNEARK